ncbi:aromatic acid exporter family member 1 [Glaciihabitans tibetensis]|uniref:Aromatic acid exporter family member 1 n=1 Tax=Glaciihabitans tibetensis TaxID=1266600 RepID=A0A2T0V6V6_9MICO|nr:aromatic acid exporter family protein [Glaciihabitans tibetensis]PRY65910.1 aromatic acid exporter family member 1 [Glaciihabitans tibetensis]
MSSSVLTQLGSGIRHPRTLLALKTALAVGLAWSVAPHLPGSASDYPYYGPLGALISMHPTLMRSITTGLRTLAGLVIGMLLAATVIIFAEPNVVTISLVVGAGVLVAGARWLGAGSDTVPTAVLFVLIIGGPNADSYSVGYLVQMTAGILIGLAVNMLIFPPLTVGSARDQLARFRASLADQLDDMAQVLRESWPPEHEDWATRGTQLATVADDVRTALQAASDSRRINPRTRLRRNRHDLTRDYEDLAAFERITFHVRDITDVLANAVWGTEVRIDLDPEVCDVLSDAFTSISPTLRSWDEPTRSAALEEARSTLATVGARAQRAGEKPGSGMNPASVIALDLSRILAVVDDRQPE